MHNKQEAERTTAASTAAQLGVLCSLFLLVAVTSDSRLFLPFLAQPVQRCVNRRPRGRGVPGEKNAIDRAWLSGKHCGRRHGAAVGQAYRSGFRAARAGLKAPWARNAKTRSTVNHFGRFLDVQAPAGVAAGQGARGPVLLDSPAALPPCPRSPVLTWAGRGVR